MQLSLLPVESTEPAVASRATAKRCAPSWVDFTAFRHPVLAVRCPQCLRNPGAWCVRPSGHKAMDLHDARKKHADEVFVAQYGPDAWIENTSLATAHPVTIGYGIWRVFNSSRNNT